MSPIVGGGGTFSGGEGEPEVTYYVNPDGTFAYHSECPITFAVIDGGEVQEGAEEVTLEEYEDAIAALDLEIEEYVADLITDDETAAAAHAAARATVLAALATASGLTVEEIEEALA